MGKLKETMIRDMKVHGYSEQTIKTYTNCIQKLANFHNQNPIELKAEHIYDFFLHLREKQLADATVSLYYSAIHLFCTLFGKESILERIPVPKKRAKVVVVLTQNEVVSILNHCTTLKERAIFTLLYSSGIRIGELAKLKLSDIDFESQSILIREGKGNKQRYAILSNSTGILLKQFILLSNPTTYLFYSSQKGKEHAINVRWIQVRLKEIAKTGGIRKNIKVHTLRHSFATHLLEDGYSIFYIQKLLGHNTIVSTMIYLHVNPHHLLQIPSPIEKIRNAKMNIFENQKEYGLNLNINT